MDCQLPGQPDALVLLVHILRAGIRIYLLLCVCDVATAEYTGESTETGCLYPWLPARGADKQVPDRNTQPYYAGGCARPGYRSGLAILCSCWGQSAIECCFCPYRGWCGAGYGQTTGSTNGHA